MSASLAAQRAIRERLVSHVGSLVPAANILDRNARPNPVPSIILGEDQEVDESDIARRKVRVYSTLHVWQKEPGLVGVKAIAGAIRTAFRERIFHAVLGFNLVGAHVSSARFMRDPDGIHAHAVVTIESIVHEAQP